MRNKTLTALIAIGFVSIVSSHAQAQSTVGALQLGLGTSLLTYSSASITEHNVPQPGGAPPADYKSIEQNTTWGLSSRNTVGLEAGYGITDILVLGGMLDIGGWSNTTGADAMVAGAQRQNEFRFSMFVGPKLDVMFLPDSVVRPFIGAAVGLARVTDTRQTTTQNANGTSTTTTPYDFGVTGIGLLARAGIRWFVTPGFSLDPAFVFGFTAASGSIVVPVGAATRSDDTGASAYTVGLRLGFSGWVGL